MFPTYKPKFCDVECLHRGIEKERNSGKRPKVVKVVL